MKHLDPTVVAEDNRLERESERSTEALARLRWHWTLNRANPDRVTIRQYAFDVARTDSIIGRHANGYAEWLEKKDEPGSLSLTETLALYRFGRDFRPVVAAVSKAIGVGASGIKQSPEHKALVTSAHEIAKSRAAENNTSIEDEAADAVAVVMRRKAAEEAAQAERRKRHSLRYLQADAALVKARKSLVKVISEIRGVEFTEDERSMLIREFERIESVIPLVSIELKGNSGVDWDAALVALGESR